MEEIHLFSPRHCKFPLINKNRYSVKWTSQVVLVVKNVPANAETRVQSLGQEDRSPGGGHSNSLQYSCLENLIKQGASHATVHRVAKSQTRLNQLSRHTLLSNAESTVSATPTKISGLGSPGAD